MPLWASLVYVKQTSASWVHRNINKFQSLHYNPNTLGQVCGSGTKHLPWLHKILNLIPSTTLHLSVMPESLPWWSLEPQHMVTSRSITTLCVNSRHQQQKKVAGEGGEILELLRGVPWQKVISIIRVQKTVCKCLTGSEHTSCMLQLHLWARKGHSLDRYC